MPTQAVAREQKQVPETNSKLLAKRSRGKYNYKISDLTGKRNGTDNTEARAYEIHEAALVAARNAGWGAAEYLEQIKDKVRNVVAIKVGILSELARSCNSERTSEIVAEGIAALKALLPKVEAATTPEAAFALKDAAYAIYGATHEKAKAACDGRDDLTEKEKAAKALKEARYATLSLIERKAAIMHAAAQASDNEMISKIYEEAAKAVADLEGEARAAKTIEALYWIEKKVMAIYHGARESIADLHGDHKHGDDGDKSDDKKDDEGTKDDHDDKSDDHNNDPTARLDEHLGKVDRYIDYLVDIASATADGIPETFAALRDAHDGVHEAMAAVLAVTESGKRLDQKWGDLLDALKTFKRAFVAHYVALARGPFSLGRIHIPG